MVDLTQAAKDLAKKHGKVDGDGKPVIGAIDQKKGTPVTPAPKPPKEKKPRLRPAKTPANATVATATKAEPGPVAPITPTTVTPAPAITPAKPAEEVSFLDLIDAAADGGSVKKNIEDARTVLNDPKRAGIFIGAVADADELASMKLDSEGLDNWFSLGLEEVKKELASWGDPASAKVLGRIVVFEKSSVGIITQLWQYVTEVVRPAKEIKRFDELETYMNNLAAKKWIDSGLNGERRPGCIELRRNGSKNVVRYYPIKHRDMAGLAWDVVHGLHVEIRNHVHELEKARDERYRALKAEDTGTSYADVKKGMECKLFIDIDSERHQGILLRIWSDNPESPKPKARVLNGVGIKLNKAPENISLDAPMKQWDSEGLFEAIAKWKARR